MQHSANLFMFRSSHTPGLSCFASDPAGSGLPAQLSPWVAVGVLRADQTPPHGLSRSAIESGIRAAGYQLFRSRKKP
jgi:hypothetical protein